MIKLPNYVWFLGNIPFRGDGNIYSGSAGCNPVLGNIEGKTFRYRVWLNKNEEGLELVAVNYIGDYAYEYTDESLIEKMVFEASPKGIEEAEEWLNEKQDSAINLF